MNPRPPRLLAAALAAVLLAPAAAPSAQPAGSKPGAGRVKAEFWTGQRTETVSF